MAIVDRLLKKILGDPQSKVLKHYRSRVQAVNALEPQLENESDDALRAKTTAFKERLKKGDSLDSLLVEAFALVREASKRTLSMRHFDVQLIGGMVLHEGNISEMKTGEGKTLVSTLAAYLNALEGKGVYIVTVNDYLAKRDSEWMGKLFSFLGLSVGLIQHDMPPEERLKAYQADITYGTNNEFGFDYLRDNLAWEKDQCCQTRRHYAIIDEVDSILIDEARTPLIISGPVKQSTANYLKLVSIVRCLEKETHFNIEEKQKNVFLTEQGIDTIEKEIGISNIYSVQNMEIAHMAVQGLRALHLYKRDVDYVVKNGEVIIVDEFTGRLMEGRRYSDGLHQSIEALEGLTVQEESQTLASVTFQNYFRMFPKLSGMTGTAATEAGEFESIYNLSVVSIPTNRPMVREDVADVVYKSKTEKYKAIVNTIKRHQKTGRPTLVGTIAIETSELLSSMLNQEGIAHTVLNAKHHEKEAEIISKAGQKNSVTIATNMAGRGTDIVLGEGVKELGGLCVIGSERHESRRIDNQLRGRSGRQGDPGWSRFFVALDDDLMRLFGSDRIATIMDKLGVPADTPIEHGLITRSIEKAQHKVEKYHFSIRKQILEYDDVLNKQREGVYDIRHRILVNDAIEKLVRETLSDFIETVLSDYPELTKNKEQQAEALERLTAVFPLHHTDNIFRSSQIKIIQKQLVDVCFQFYSKKKQEFPPGLFDTIVTRRILLMTLDRKWVDHLNNMEVLREGIGLRAWGQRDPLIEYKREAYDLFTQLLHDIYEEAWTMINRVELVENDPNSSAFPNREISLSSDEVVQDKKKELPTANNTSQTSKLGRNDPCSCGSGRKYKKCCMN